MTRTPNQRGFTLVEVMVALMIFGMIAAAGVALLSFSIRAQAATAAKLDETGATERLVSIMGADLAQALDRPARDTGGTRLPAFVGESDGALRFVRSGWTNVDAAPRASAQKVEYRLDGNDLVRIAYPMLDGASSLPAAAVLGGVKLAAMRYRFAGAWSDRWDGTQGSPLPQALELVLTRADGKLFRALFLVGSGELPRPSATPAAPGPEEASDAP